jgi:hypothetical protein
MSWQQRAARPSASEPFTRSPAASRSCHSASGRVLATRLAGTKCWSNRSCTVRLAITATICTGSADSDSAAAPFSRVWPASTSSTAQTIVSCSSRAATYSVSVSPQPVTHGEVPSSR